jgi:hypothetical protein
MNCCDDNGNCRQGRDCPVRTRRVRAGQPAPPIFLDPEHFEVEERSDSFAAVVVLVIIALVFVATAVIVGVV